MQEGLNSELFNINTITLNFWSLSQILGQLIPQDKETNAFYFSHSMLLHSSDYNSHDTSQPDVSETEILSGLSY